MKNQITTQLLLVVAMVTFSSVIYAETSVEQLRGQAQGIGNTKATACEMAKKNALEVASKSGIGQRQEISECICRALPSGERHHCAINLINSK